MPPKKGNVIIKKDSKINTDKKVNNKDTFKKLKKNEASLKSTDDGDLPDDSDYESEDLSELSDSENEIDTLSQNNDNINDEDNEEEDEEESVVEESEEPDVESEEEEEVVESDECMYKKAKVKNLDDEKDDDEIELVYDDDNINYDEIVKPEDRISKPFMTVFERVRLLGDRAKQLSLGAKPMIKGLETMNPKEIARLELEKGVIPLIIERLLPNGKKERWHVNELKIIN